MGTATNIGFVVLIIFLLFIGVQLLNVTNLLQQTTDQQGGTTTNQGGNGSGEVGGTGGTATGVTNADVWPSWVYDTSNSGLIQEIELIILLLLGELSNLEEKKQELEDEEKKKVEDETRNKEGTENENEHKRSAIEESEEKIKDIERKIAEKEHEIRETLNEHESIESELERAKASIEDEHEKIKELEEKLANNEDRLKQAIEDKQRLQDSLETEKERFTQAVDEREGFLKELQKVEEAKSNLDAAQDELNKAKDALDAENQRSELTLEEKENLLKELQDKLEKAKNNLDAAQQQIKEALESEQKRLGLEIEQKEKSLRELQEKLKEVQESINKSNDGKAIEALQTAQKRLELEIQQKEKALRDLQENSKEVRDNLASTKQQIKEALETATKRLGLEIEQTERTLREFQDKKAKTASAIKNNNDPRSSRPPHENAPISSTLSRQIAEGSGPNPKKVAERVRSVDDPIKPPFFKQRAMTAFGSYISGPLSRTSAYKALVKIDELQHSLSKRFTINPAIYKRSARVQSAIAVGAESLMTVMDELTIAMTFTDAFYFGMNFPSETDLISPDTFKDFFLQSVYAQADSFNEYNSFISLDNKNNIETYGYSPVSNSAYAQYPIVAGPLDIAAYYDFNADGTWTLSQNTGLPPQYKGDPYYNQTRVQLEIDTIREQIVRDQTKPYYAIIDSGLQTLGSSIASVIADSNLVINVLNGILTATDLDSLYRTAYTTVCTKYGGIVYEDTFKYGWPYIGRPRFQCGWKEKDCSTWNSMWSKQTEQSTSGIIGNYAEWYDLRQVQTLLSQSSTNIAYDGDPWSVTKIPLDISRTITSYGTNTSACLITNAGGRSMCNALNGDYSIQTHQCTFTPEYCQSLGTCFDPTTKTCTLKPVADRLEAMSFFFGTGGPREFIKIHGCKLDFNDPGNILAIGTHDGALMLKDAVMNVKNWGPGLKASFSDPANAMTVVASFAGLALVASGGAGAAVLAPVIVLAGLGAGIAAAVEAGMAKREGQSHPPSESQEYSVGGLITGSDGQKSAKAVTFLKGWVTKPMKIHRDGPFITSPSPLQTQSILGGLDNQVGYVIRKPFFENPGGVWDGNAVGYSGVANIAKKFCYTENPPKMRAGAKTSGQPGTGCGDGTNGCLWCIDQFPGDRFTDKASIGTLMTTDTTFLVSNIWTDGSEPGFPLYPENAKQCDLTGGDNPWYYQLVYDPEKMVGYNDPCTYNSSTGTSSCTGPVTLPSNLWNDTILLTYFSEQTVTSMRQYYCNKLLTSDLNKSNFVGNSKCWGYLNIKLNNFTVSPMSILSSRAT